MYKSKLQELCHRRSWNSPDYRTSKEGPDHSPRYTSTITVHGVDFQTPSPCRTAKESQNIVAKLALDHFSHPKPSPPNPPSSFSPPPSKKPPFSEPSFPQPSLAQPSLSLTQPSLSLPQPSLSFPQPSLSFPQPSLSLSTGSSVPDADVDIILPTRSVKQPKFEEASQATQINRPVTSVNDIITAGNQKNDSNMQRLYKNQLQNYAQKRNLNLPVYSSVREGPPHASRFKCTISIDGQTFESHEFFPTLKDAEHAVAKVALMSLSPVEAQEDDTGLYKNLLQELVQREGFRLPVYSTNKSGEAHIPIFVSNVEIESEIFTGEEAKTKKQAEMSAAKVAYTILKERKGKSNSLILLSAHKGQAPEFSSPSSESNVITDLQHHADAKSCISYSPGLVTQNQSEKDKECSEVQGHHTAIPYSKPATFTGGRDSSSSEITISCVKDASLSNVQSSHSLPNSSSMAIDSSAASTSTCRRVIVYSRKTNVEIAEGGTLLPISDENYAAYSYPN